MGFLSRAGWALLWTILWHPCPAGAEAPSLTFGIVPQAASARLAEQWLPLLDEVGKRAGVRLNFRTNKDIPTFEEGLALGAYDFAYMNPYHYSVFHRASGYGAFAHEQGRPLAGIIVVRADSPYTAMADLAGKAVIFPAPGAFAASILTQAEFARLGIPVVAKYVISHDSVYRGVLGGHFAAGGGIPRTFDALPLDQKAGLRILATTREYTPHPFAAHPRVSAEVVARVRAALISLGQDEVGRRALDAASLKAIVGADDSEWNDVRGLDIDLLRHWLGQTAE
ncbi:phosphate ABC transporter substrate-binding protein [Paramagnetospirillum kuznetsovii]|uniref:Phosphate ABC transporter substrate-binding protein n=1 Tax=Paramagnetospirillum kuznetsovii TaxID=2053833 RepID=A0A364NV55_9PROT|nr:phosphate/phosphite/phosphonate ABC transporter substrate-binding protein [Paramagnetospirillum kuznetsovii]RAU20964.1 phosphate ABC transporter substrate-binding protein [Paramagnetospirillum kuznetsovii]